MDLFNYQFTVYFVLEESVMTSKKTSEAQLKASRKWQEKNKEHMNYIRKRSAARGFIKVATQEDLDELKQLISERQNETKKNLPTD